MRDCLAIELSIQNSKSQLVEMNFVAGELECIREVQEPQSLTLSVNIKSQVKFQPPVSFVEDGLHQEYIFAADMLRIYGKCYFIHNLYGVLHLKKVNSII